MFACMWARTGVKDIIDRSLNTKPTMYLFHIFFYNTMRVVGKYEGIKSVAMCSAILYAVDFYTNKMLWGWSDEIGLFAGWIVGSQDRVG